MAKKTSSTKNPTLLKLKGTPFKTAAELKFHEEKILKEEWQVVQRARVRRELMKRPENKIVLVPFSNGLNAKFVSEKDERENLIRVFLTEHDAIQVELDKDLRSKDNGETIDSLVRSLVEVLLSGYLTALGLTEISSLKNKIANESVSKNTKTLF